MSGSYENDRGTAKFWYDLGLTEAAASVAAQCFPEYWIPYCEHAFRTIAPAAYYYPDVLQERSERESLLQAEKAAAEAPAAFRTDARHPAFWYAQGYDFDEMAARAVAAVAMVKLQQEAAPPPKPDRFADMAMALTMLGTLRNSSGHTHDAEFNDPQMPRRLEAPPNPPQQPFDPNDYPRFRAE